MTFATDAQRRWFFAHLGETDIRGDTAVPAELIAHSHWLTSVQKQAVSNYNVRGKTINREHVGDPALDAAIDSAPPVDVVVSRGELPMTAQPPGHELVMLNARERDAFVRDYVHQWALDRYPVGAVVEIGTNYTSASFRTAPALDASLGRNYPGVVFEIAATHGLFVGGVQGLTFDDEAEFLMPRGAKFRVQSVFQGKLSPDLLDDRVEPKLRTIIKVVQL